MYDSSLGHKTGKPTKLKKIYIESAISPGQQFYESEVCSEGWDNLIFKT